MTTSEQIAKAESFRARHHVRPPLLLPNAWDGMSARLIEAVGFEAVATTSGGVAWSLGYPDGEAAPWEEIVAATGRIVRSVALPVTADIEAGYAETSDALARHVGEIVATGIAGINLEDGMPQAGMQVRPLAEAVERIAVSREAAQRAGVPLVINARTDHYLRRQAGDPAIFEETVERGKAYLAAGADCVYPIGLVDPPTIGDFIARVGGPVNIMGRPGTPDIAALERLGVARVSTATSLSLAVMGLTREILQQLRADGRFDTVRSAMSYPDAQRLFHR